MHVILYIGSHLLLAGLSLWFVLTSFKEWAEFNYVDFRVRNVGLTWLIVLIITIINLRLWPKGIIEIIGDLL